MQLTKTSYHYRYLNGIFEALIIIKIKDKDQKTIEAKTNDILAKINNRKVLSNTGTILRRGESKSKNLKRVSRGKVKTTNSASQTITKFSTPKAEYILPRERY